MVMVGSGLLTIRLCILSLSWGKKISTLDIAKSQCVDSKIYICRNFNDINYKINVYLYLYQSLTSIPFKPPPVH